MSALEQPPSALLALRATNVSSPSIVHRRSEQSITASEDYYSLSSSRSHSSNDLLRSTTTLRRYTTPPSRYRTPAHSRDDLATPRPHESSAATSTLRGAGQRRQSLEGGTERGAPSTVSAPMYAHMRDGGVRRKPVPSAVVERPQSTLSAAPAIPSRGTIIDERSNFDSPPTPNPHDEQQYIRFALEQLTRDEEVRGSRRYDGLGSGRKGNFAYLEPDVPRTARNVYDGSMDGHPPASRQESVAKGEGLPSDDSRSYAQTGDEAQQEQEDPLLPVLPPLGHPRRQRTPPLGASSSEGYDPVDHAPAANGFIANEFLPLAANATHPLDFVPGILRSVQLSILLFLLLAFVACLMFCAIYSLQNTGLCDYGSFGDSRYFVFEYLPTLIGMFLLFWIFEVQRAVTRIAPFVGLASDSRDTRVRSTDLPLSQAGFLRPCFEYFTAGLSVIGAFQVAAWLALFTIPLLASSFNAYFYGSPDTGRWRWIATQGAIWSVIGLYLVLAASLVALLVWVHTARRRNAIGLQWDPRSLADLLVMLARSNALAEDVDLNAQETARLGFWRTQGRPNDAFYAYGLAHAEPRQYLREGGRIREHARSSAEGLHRPDSDSNEKRRSHDPMIRQQLNPSFSTGARHQHITVPWFLRPVFTSLWALIALVLLLAFLILSYLPSTRVSLGFEPTVPAPVNRLGFSSTNFLYSFLPALLGELCLLLWLECEAAHRHLAPFLSLLGEDSHSPFNNEKAHFPTGASAEKTLLPSYPADLPFVITVRAVVNADYRLASLSMISLLAATLPVLGGGVFWAQFLIPLQRVKMSAHMPGYYALTFFVVIFALSWILLLPISKAERKLSHMDSGDPNSARTFADVIALVRYSKLLDDVAFHQPGSKVQLVTRLLSSEGGETGSGYAFAQFRGRDGVEFTGVDRLRG